MFSNEIFEDEMHEVEMFMSEYDEWQSDDRRQRSEELREDMRGDIYG